MSNTQKNVLIVVPSKRDGDCSTGIDGPSSVTNVHHNKSKSQVEWDRLKSVPLPAPQDYLGCNKPIMLPSGSASHANLPVGIGIGFTSVLPPSAVALSR